MSPIVEGRRPVQSAGMTVTEELPTGPPSDVPAEAPEETPPESSEPLPLRRSTTKRLVAGVCGGIAERFEVDVTIVRVAFVVAACLWGIGVVVYLSLWALVPVTDGAGPDPDPAAHQEPSGPPWVSYVLLTAALFLGLVISTSWWGGPQWGGGLGLAWLVVLFVGVVVALRRPARRPTLGRALLTLALILLSLVILATAAFFGAVAVTGVPLTGGIGQRVVQPTTPAELQPSYRMAIGNLTVDLTHVPLGAGTRTVSASVAVGPARRRRPPGRGRRRRRPQRHRQRHLRLVRTAGIRRPLDGVRTGPATARHRRPGRTRPGRTPAGRLLTALTVHSRRT